VNDDKTKAMELLPMSNNVVIQVYTFEKVHQFRYSDTTISADNDWLVELNSRIIKLKKA